MIESLAGAIWKEQWRKRSLDIFRIYNIDANNTTDFEKLSIEIDV